MKIVKDKVLNYREVIVELSKNELTKLISDYIAKQNKFYGEDYKTEVTIIEVKEGSPAYNVGCAAIIKITEDLSPKAKT